MISVKRKALSIIISIFVITTFVMPCCAFADELNGITVKVSKEIQVVDTMKFRGQSYEAVYHPIYNIPSDQVFCDSTYCCAALVSKFYKSAFGVDMSYLMPGEFPEADNAEFIETNTPEIGDIYGSYNHWAIVKEVEGDTVTLFEQNWCWVGDDKGTTYAQYSRKVDVRHLNSSESFYTLKTEPEYGDRISIQKLSVNLEELVKRAVKYVIDSTDILLEKLKDDDRIIEHRGFSDITRMCALTGVRYLKTAI